MKIVIDATTLLLRSAGVKNYIHYWLTSLKQVAGHADAIRTYPPRIPLNGSVDHEREASGFIAQMQLRMVGFCNARPTLLSGLLFSGADVFHASQHAAYLPKGVRSAATIFDLSCWTVPETHTPANVAATKMYAERILKNCDGLIAISQHAKSDAVEWLGISPERIRVVYPGVREIFFNVGMEEADRVRSHYSMTRPYLLFVGCIEPRKNVANLLEAYRRLPETVRRDLELIIAGPFGWESEDLRRTLTSGAIQGVRYLGYVPEEHLPALFRGAAALVYPSFYEGFGFPAAQAMAAGIPVIASNRSCLPEVIGGGGLFVNPDSVEELAFAMEQVVSSPDLHAELAYQGNLRAQGYRWPVSAKESLRFFHGLA